MTNSTCLIEDCGKPAHSRDMCPMHYQRVRANGSPFRYRTCVQCGALFDGHGGRKTCSTVCAEGRMRSWENSASDVWKGKPRIPCSECGGATGWADLPSARERAMKGNSGRGPVCNPCRRSRPGYKPRVSGRRKDRTEENVCERCDEVWTRPVTKGQRPKYCPDCRGDYRRWIPIAVRRGVYERDSWVCGICLEHVDEGLIGSKSPWRPSLDHVVPRSEGGSDEPENLRLSHFWCNGVLNDGRAYSDDDFRIAS